jgi:hypothetical protein
MALRRIATSEGLLGGRGAATAGLVLCVSCGLAAVSRDAVTRHLRTRQAEQVSRNWIGLLLAGDTGTAFRLTVEASRPAPPPEPGMPAPKANPYEEFRKHSLVQAISTIGSDSQIELVRTLRYVPETHRQFVVAQQFSIVPSEAATDADPNLRPVQANLTLQRSWLRGERKSRWLVAAYELTPAKDNATIPTEDQ